MSMNQATHVSVPGQPDPYGVPGAPGSGGPAAQMATPAALAWVVVGAAVVTIGTGYVARKGVKPELGRYDVVQAIYSGTSAVVFISTLKLLAYRYHGHKVSQAILLLA